MTELQSRAIYYIQKLPQNKLEDVVEYLLDIFEMIEDEMPLDDFDYELSQRADEALANGDMKFVSFEEILAKDNLTREDLKKINGNI